MIGRYFPGDRWIRWKARGEWSLWHRAPPAKALIRVRQSATEEIFQVAEAVEKPTVFEVGTMYRYTACGFVIPPHEMIEHWTNDAMPPLPRCIWCVHGWVVDTSPPGGAPPTQGGERRSIVIRTRGKKAPTQHA